MLKQETLLQLTGDHLVSRSLAMQQRHDVVDGQTAKNAFITDAAELQKLPEVTTHMPSTVFLHGLIKIASEIDWDTVEGMKELLKWVYSTRDVLYRQLYEEVARQRAQEEDKATPSDTPTS